MNKHRTGVFLGVAFFVLTWIFPSPEGLGDTGWKVVGVALLMAVFWLSECIPISATALIPLVLFPLLGVLSIRETAAPYANPLIFLFLGGFLIAHAIEKTGLHRRLALLLLSRCHPTPRGIVLGLLITSATISMWVSNTATALMMLPIAFSILSLFVDEEPKNRHVSSRALLAVAYGCTIGGVATLIGTPPNALLAAFLEETRDYTIGFSQWMLIGIPIAAVGLVAAYFVLRSGLDRKKGTAGIEKRLQQAQRNLGPISFSEKCVSIVFAVTAVAWMTRPIVEQWIPAISDAGIAIAAGVVFFLIPMEKGSRGFILEADAFSKIPLGILILFGGGLSLAAAMKKTDLDDWMGVQFGALSGVPEWMILVLFCGFILLLTELTSNTATTATFLPVAAALSLSLDSSESALLAGTALAASCAFMMPVGTPPNAVVYGTGQIGVREMIRSGIRLNLLFLVLIVVAVKTLGPFVF
ncbi:MAG: SLC13 family permease [Verrucomicrobiota bacterium]